MTTWSRQASRVRQQFGGMDARRSRNTAWALAALVLVIGGAYATYLGGQVRYLDERVYLQLAHYLVHGHGYTADGTTPTAYRPPGYPFLLAGVELAHGGIFVMRMLNFAALAGSVLFAHRLVLRIASPGIAAAAAAVVAIYPLFIYAAGALYPQITATFLLLAALELVQRAGDSQVSFRARMRLAVITGLILGVLTEDVPTFGVTAVAMCAWLLFRKLAGARSVAGLAFAAFAILPGLWCVRNAVEMHAFVPVSTNNGVNLLLGNSVHANAFGGRLVDIRQYEDPAHAQHLGEVALDHRFTSEAWAWVRDNPARAGWLYVEKVASNFSYSSPLATQGADSSGKKLLAAVSYYPILLLALARLLLWRRRPLLPLEKGIAGLIAANVLLLAVFYTRVRFRIPLDALTIALAASGLSRILSVWRDKKALQAPLGQSSLGTASARE
jgi:4-amino-4-deoxy-L-arabinose transferase-like glycosyltransferase